MPILLRAAVVAALWLFSRRKRASVLAGRLDSLSWPDRLRLVWNLSQDKRIPIWSRAVLLGPAAYLLSPIDLLPDFIPFLGRLDDTLVFSTCMDIAAFLIPDHLFEQHLNRVAPATQGRTTASGVKSRS